MAVLLALAGVSSGLAAGPAVPTLKVKAGAPMLVESDELVYDYDRKTVSAVGNVKIYYSGYSLEAERVTYLQTSHRLIAAGAVKLIDPSGIASYAEQIDITDDFSDGFIQSLRVDTPDKTHFAAERAERSGGDTTTFVNGVYTACEPCKDNPEKPPLWQVSAKRIIIDHKEKMIYFRSAALEFMGVPIAWVPYFATPDPSVKRKTGLLAPIFGYSDALGWSVTVPYFIALAPNYDLTLTPSYLTKQGFLGDIEWRHRLSNGYYTIRVAGISQNDPAAFLTPLGGGTFAQRTLRGGIRSTGEFNINRYWSFGWDGTLSSDRTFTRNYSVLNNDLTNTVSNVHLTGQSDRNYFDMRAMYFQVLVDSQAPLFEQGRQAAAIPVIDYYKVLADPVLGGELTLTSNLTNLARDKDDPFMVPGDPTVYYHGLAGNFVRGTAQLDWQSRFVGPMGQLITPFASLRGDAFGVDATGAVPAGFTTDSSAGRFMPAVGVEWSWPVMIQAGSSSHVIEPIAQVIVRPDEPMAGQLPNDDAQSLVFEAASLFDHDKFSGYDRVEGGTRLNAGVRYTGAFANGMTAGAVFGQSFQLAGKNSFAQPDVADAGGFSGLETANSDYVAGASLDNGAGQRLMASTRFDEQDFSLERLEVGGTAVLGTFIASANYLYLRQDPNAGVITPQSVVSAAASVDVAENWRLFATLAYDINKDSLARDSIGVAFDNSCLTLSIAYSEARGNDIPDRKVSFKLLMRTLGEGTATATISKPN